MRFTFVIMCVYLSLVGCCREVTQPKIVANSPKIVALIKFSEEITSVEDARRALVSFPVESVEVSVRRMNLYRVVLRSDENILSEIRNKKSVIDAEKSAVYWH